MTVKVPDECYQKYGSDLDGCSTQEREGCGSCVLAKAMTDHLTPAEIEGMREFWTNGLDAGYHGRLAPIDWISYIYKSDKMALRLLAAYSELEKENERLEDEIGKLQMTVDLLAINVRTGKPAIVTAPKGDE